MQLYDEMMRKKKKWNYHISVQITKLIDILKKASQLGIQQGSGIKEINYSWYCISFFAIKKKH